MPRQSKRKLNEFFGEFPALAQVYGMFVHEMGKLPVEAAVYVQRPDPEMMYLQASNLYKDQNAYVLDSETNTLRGTRGQVMMAVNDQNEILDVLDWPDGLDYYTTFAKDIFNHIDTASVKYLMWVTRIRWFQPPSPEMEEKGQYFGEKVKGLLEIIIYPVRKDMTWKKLIEVAEREKKDREEAYLYPPRLMPDVPGIEKALNEGCRLHAFLSGGGLRVVSLTKGNKDQAYGEHPHVEVALMHLSEDYLAGGFAL